MLGLQVDQETTRRHSLSPYPDLTNQRLVRGLLETGDVVLRNDVWVEGIRDRATSWLR